MRRHAVLVCSSRPESQVNMGLSHHTCWKWNRWKPGRVYPPIIYLLNWFCLWRHSSSSWAHHSAVGAAAARTPADIQYLITATGWLDYRRHWLEYLQQTHSNWRTSYRAENTNWTPAGSAGIITPTWSAMGRCAGSKAFKAFPKTLQESLHLQ